MEEEINFRIKKLVSEGNTESAINEFLSHLERAGLSVSRYNIVCTQLKKTIEESSRGVNLGIQNFSEHSRISSTVTYQLLNLLDCLKNNKQITNPYDRIITVTGHQVIDIHDIFKLANYDPKEGNTFIDWYWQSAYKNNGKSPDKLDAGFFDAFSVIYNILIQKGYTVIEIPKVYPERIDPYDDFEYIENFEFLTTGRKNKAYSLFLSECENTELIKIQNIVSEFLSPYKAESKSDLFQIECFLSELFYCFERKTDFITFKNTLGLVFDDTYINNMPNNLHSFMIGVRQIINKNYSLPEFDLFNTKYSDLLGFYNVMNLDAYMKFSEAMQSIDNSKIEIKDAEEISNYYLNNLINNISSSFKFNNSSNNYFFPNDYFAEKVIRNLNGEFPEYAYRLLEDIYLSNRRISILDFPKHRTNLLGKYGLGGKSLESIKSKISR